MRWVCLAATNAPDHQALQKIDQLDAHLLDELEHFFISYNTLRGRRFTPRSRSGPLRARQMIEEGRQTFATRQ